MGTLRCFRYVKLSTVSDPNERQAYRWCEIDLIGQYSWESRCCHVDNRTSRRLRHPSQPPSRTSHKALIFLVPTMPQAQPSGSSVSYQVAAGTGGGCPPPADAPAAASAPDSPAVPPIPAAPPEPPAPAAPPAQSTTSNVKDMVGPNHARPSSTNRQVLEMTPTFVGAVASIPSPSTKRVRLHPGAS